MTWGVQEGEGRLAPRAIGRPRARPRRRDVRARRGEPPLRVARWRLAGGDVEAPLEGLEGGDQPVDVHGLGPRHPHRRHDRREVADDLLLLWLIIGDEEQREVDPSDAAERAERIMLTPDLVE